MVSTFEIIDANTMFGVHPTHRFDMSIERLLREMDRNNISASLTLSTTGVFHNHSRGNAMTLEATRANDRLVPVATINPIAYFGGPEDMKAISSRGFRIFKFYPHEQGWDIESAAFRLVLSQLAVYQAAVMVNASTTGEPTTVARMTSSYPGRVILCDIGFETLSEALAVMLEAPNVMLETHALHVPGALKLIADRVGAGRIVFGSGAPRCSIASSLHYVLNSELSDSDKQLILAGNIRTMVEGN